ncbi:hypothetical protein CSOJ01_05062 [Colletotrichum sojae]|uniref:Uncharacterized protein n=1 Tax=Colletotrichum sojae TaxID=2175907 RepID=A0A8H6MY85_9PEZI|nr:hypothetical protein CSOJ01_05062 [Colletotrichum sojae]
MANRERYFFYAPTWDYPPNGPIKLGNVIPSVKKPQQALSCVSPEDSILLKTEKRLMLGFGVDIGAEIDNNDEESFTSVESANVRRFLQTSRYRKPVYIITGVKIVTGAKANSTKSRSVGGNLAVEVDGTLLSGGAVPIGGGPGIEGKVGKKAGTSWEGSSDFVFAYRVSKVFRKEVKLQELAVLKIEEPAAEAEGFDAEQLLEDGDVVFCAIHREEESDE